LQYRYGRQREKVRRPTGALNAMRDVSPRFSQPQRFQMESRGHTLRKLAHLIIRKHEFQLGLPNQNNVQQLIFIRFEIGEEPQWLQYLSAKILRLVDNKHCTPVFGMKLLQMHTQSVRQGTHRVSIRSTVTDTEFRADCAEELFDPKMRIRTQNHSRSIHLMGYERTDQSGLANANVADQDPQTILLAGTVEQICKRSPMACT